jgi:putative FmdB family regulatory protein
MPIYEYKCQDCQKKFEVLHRAGEEKEVVCPYCGSKNAKRVMSVFATTGLDVPSSGCSSCSGSSCSTCGL